MNPYLQIKTKPELRALRRVNKGNETVLALIAEAEKALLPAYGPGRLTAVQMSALVKNLERVEAALVGEEHADLRAAVSADVTLLKSFKPKPAAVVATPPGDVSATAAAPEAAAA